MMKKKLKHIIFIMLFVAMLNFSNVVCYAAEAITETEVETEIETESESETETESESETQTEETTEESELIKVTELDLGDYTDVMAIGDRQLLIVTVLPIDAIYETIKYSSSNTDVATINGMGRITAISTGTTTITVSCGNIEEEFILTVKKSLSDIEERIPVLDIELADFDPTVVVGKVLNLSATVLPVGAFDTTIEYESDNPQVATVSSSGEVKGLSKGKVNITLCAGDIEKTITLEVKVETTSIMLNETYVVLKPGDTFQVKGSVKPKDADGILLYKSVDGNVATVSEAGVITAKEVGNTTVIVSNSDMSNAITVIVNKNGVTENLKTETAEAVKTILSNNDNNLLQLIQNQEYIEIQSKEYPVLNKTILKELYSSGKTLRVLGQGYTLSVDGSVIKNYENAIKTELNFVETDNGRELLINNGEKLPGEIVVLLDNMDYKYVYLYNEAKEKYEKINSGYSKELHISTEGKYLLTTKQLNGFTIQIYVIVGSVVIFLGLLVGYIVVKKRYWFW